MGIRELGTEVNWRCPNPLQRPALSPQQADGCHSLRVLVIFQQEPEIQIYFYEKALKFLTADN